MTKIEENKLSAELKEELNIAVATYYAYNQDAKTAKSTADLYNTRIKEIMSEYDMSKYVSDDGYSVSVSTTNKPTYQEDKLIEYLKQYNVPGLIKTKEYVDMDVLESCIYHNEIDAKNLVPFKEDHFVTRLTCKCPKILNE